MPVMTSTETILRVSAATPATFDEAGYAALTFTEVKEVTTIPAYGPTRQVVNHEPLATGVTEKYGGFINYGSVAVDGAYDSIDAGQSILRANVLSATALLSVAIEYQDGSIDYTYGKAFSATKAPGSANSMVGSSMNIEFNKPIVEVAA